MGCVYMITNKVTRMKYIGATSKTLQTRLNEHECLSNIRNSRLYEAFKLTGIDNFEAEVLFESTNLDELYDKEKEYIKLYDTIYPNGYNMTTGGKYGYDIDSVRKAQFSQSAKDRELYKYSMLSSSKKCRDIDTGIIYSSLADAGRSTGVSTSTVRKSCNKSLRILGKLFEFI